MSVVQRREATPADAPALAELAGAETAAAKEWVRRRSVSVAEADGEPVGFVAYDADTATVHVTHIHGPPDVVDDLLEVPLSFASSEGLPVEAVVPANEESVQARLVEAGFVDEGSGPRFEGKPSRRYRRDP